MTDTADIKLGVFPPPLEDFFPERWETQVALAAGTISLLTIAEFLLPGEPALQSATAAIGITGGWLMDRWNTRHQRDGFLFDKPYNFLSIAKQAAPDNANWEMTDFFRSELKIDAIVTESRSHQYRIYKISTYHPNRVEKQLEAIASKMGRNPSEVLFYPVYEAGVCAIMEILPDTEWKNVKYNPEYLQPGELLSYIGEDIQGKPMLINRRRANHMLISGMTDSGKTEVMCNDMESMRRSETPVEIYIFDPKDTAQLQRQPATFYSTDINACVNKMEYLLRVVGDERRSRYAKAGVDNFFEYRDKVNSEEPAIFIYIDELAEFLEEDLLEELEKGEKPRHIRAEHVFTRSIQKQRSAGIFICAGLQHPEAATIPTKARMNFAVIITLSVKDEKAALVAGAPGASKLPLQGGLIFQYQKRTVIGRAAYLKA